MTSNTPEPAAPRFNDDPVALFAGILLSGAMICLLAFVVIPALSEGVLPDPPAPGPGRPIILRKKA